MTCAYRVNKEDDNAGCAYPSTVTLLLSVDGQEHTIEVCDFHYRLMLKHSEPVSPDEAARFRDTAHV